MKLQKKIILIVSGQSWNGSFLSKHHYAIELGKLGNTVFFLNPPNHEFVPKIKVVPTDYLNVKSIEWSIPVHFAFKFHFLPFYRTVFLFFIKRWINKNKIDIIWDFDQTIEDLSAIEAKYKIYHPVDNFEWKSKKNIGKNADIIFSVSPIILEKFKNCNTSCHFINHGLSNEFEVYANNVLNRLQNTEILIPEHPKIGYMGNLLIDVLDIKLFSTIITDNPTLQFYFFGPYQLNLIDSNLSGSNDQPYQEWITFLKGQPNVHLFGNKKKAELLNLIEDLDMFIICYDDIKLHQRGANSHKILEYLSTGKVVISNYIEIYKQTGLIIMPNQLGSNNRLPFLLKNVITNLCDYNNKKQQTMRIEYALSNTYYKQINKIASLVSEIKN